jgi:hypothetical protein
VQIMINKYVLAYSIDEIWQAQNNTKTITTHHNPIGAFIFQILLFW